MTASAGNQRWKTGHAPDCAADISSSMSTAASAALTAHTHTRAQRHSMGNSACASASCPCADPHSQSFPLILALPSTSASTIAAAADNPFAPSAPSALALGLDHLSLSPAPHLSSRPSFPFLSSHPATRAQGSQQSLARTVHGNAQPEPRTETKTETLQSLQSLSLSLSLH